ncbi:MAG: kynurenine 3-monooxygenase [Flavobacteriales bacterium]|nr:kynurenine 3-monooxygenase [Flavobacteriales bacterium]
MYLTNKKISIVGGGLVGSLLSIYLTKQGASVSVFDKRSDIRLDKYGAGRSINLALSNRGMQALEEVGVLNEIMSIAMPMYKRIMHSVNGDLTEQPYGQKGQAIYSVSRHVLNAKLIDLAEMNSVNFSFQNACSGIDIDETQLNFEHDTSRQFDFIFGCDGVGSVVRKGMSNFSSDFNVVEELIDYGYKELTIPANEDKTHKLSKDALHIWPRQSYMVIALPNLDGTFTCTLFAPNKGQNSFESLTSHSHVDDFFSMNFIDLKQLIPDLEDQYFDNPLGSLGFIRTSSWKQNNTFLIGDSCHATIPFYGQGMNSGFEDCFLLNNYIVENGGLDVGSIDEFLNTRIINTRAMQELSRINFIEMQDRTANNEFLLQKKIEAWFSENNPKIWIPLYSMVTFSHIPYSIALNKGMKQDLIMKKIMVENNLKDPFSIVELQEKDIENKIKALIN